MTLQGSGAYPYISNRTFNVRGFSRGASIVYHQRWTDPTTAALNDIRTSLAGPNTATITLTPNSSPGLDGTLVTGAAGSKVLVLLYPRNVVITVTHGSAVVAESGVITGKDVYGRDMTEAWSVTAGTTSKTFTGAKAFKQITQITITAATDASANTNTIGDGVVFGLDVNGALAGTGAAVKEIAIGALVVTGVLVAKSSAAAADSRGTYAPSAAPNGTNDYDLWYLSDDPELS